MLVLIFFLAAFLAPDFLFAGNEPPVEFVLFHLDTCPHCKDEIKFIEKKLMPKYGEFIDLKIYEASTPENQQIFEQYGYFYKFSQVGTVPVAFIDGEMVAGYSDDETTGAQLMGIVEKKLQDKVGNEGVYSDKINIPILGSINPKTFSLPILTAVIGLLDGFNPCAMWVLLFLISLLLGMENKKRMWLLGFLFIIASGVVYFVFMVAWLQLLLFLGMIFAIRIIIGLVSIGAGGINLRDWWLHRKAEAMACKVSDLKDTKKTFEKIKAIVYRRSLLWSVAGILLLGFSVNLVELACSAGFPAVYTQVLAMSGIPAWERYLYMFGYIIFYMLDDMIVFVVAMITLKSKTVGGKYGKYSSLVGGILMLLLGLLLIFKPEWLMFS